MDVDKHTLFLGNLPKNVRTKDIERFFSNYSVRKIDIRDSRTNDSTFGLVEFKHRSDAQDAKYYLSGKELLGTRVRLDYRKLNEGRKANGGSGNLIDQYKYRCKVHGIPKDMTWRDLKSFLRNYCTSEFCDVTGQGEGVIAFFNKTDMDYAMKKLSNKTMQHNGKDVTLMMEKWGVRSRTKSRSRSPDRKKVSHEKSKE